MSNRREGRVSSNNGTRFFILFHAVLFGVSVGISVMVIYFFIIPYDELREHKDLIMALSSKISQIQISMSDDVLKQKIHPRDVLAIKKAQVDQNSELEVLKLQISEQLKVIEEFKRLRMEEVVRISKLEMNCISGLRLGSVQWTPVNGGHGYKDEYGYVLTGLINYSFDDSADQVYRRKIEKYVNGTWTSI